MTTITMSQGVREYFSRIGKLGADAHRRNIAARHALVYRKAGIKETKLIEALDLKRIFKILNKIKQPKV